MSAYPLHAPLHALLKSETRFLPDKIPLTPFLVIQMHAEMYKMCYGVAFWREH